MATNIRAAIWIWVYVGVWAYVCATGSHGHMGRHQNHGQHGQRTGQPDSGGVKPPIHRHHVPKLPPGSIQHPKILEDNKLIHDREHLKEDLPDYIPMDKIAEMSDKELDYHYFRMHDFDENLKLDGLEIMAAIMHVTDDDDDEEDGGDDGEAAGNKEGEDSLAGLNEEEQKILKDYRKEQWEKKVNFYVELVDAVMNENDLNKDGLLSWSEFLRGRRRDI